MKINLLISFTLISVLIDSLTASDTPIVGILTQETHAVRKYFPEKNYDSYIAASYVKFVESAGARVAPIWIGQNRSYYERVLNYTNGILLPGGATYFNETEGYGEAAKIIYEIAKQRNEHGIHFPILGICLGLEVLVFASNNGTDIREKCYSMKESLPLEFDEDFKKSKIFKDTPRQIVDILKTRNATYNYHRYCITDDSLKENNLTDEWRVITRNKDQNEKTFISMMESKNCPFFALQFHPEKHKFEFKKSLHIPHNVHVNRVSQYFADFFVGQCRKNRNKFPDDELEEMSLIYNFNPVFKGMNASYYQMYMFTKDDFRSHQLLLV